MSSRRTVSIQTTLIEAPLQNRCEKHGNAQMSDGSTILVTPPKVRNNATHVQETWHANIPQQSEAVTAVQEERGALNDANRNLECTFSRISSQTRIAEGEVRKSRELD